MQLDMYVYMCLYVYVSFLYWDGYEGWWRSGGARFIASEKGLPGSASEIPKRVGRFLGVPTPEIECRHLLLLPLLLLPHPSRFHRRDVFRGVPYSGAIR